MDKQPAFNTHCNLCGTPVAVPELTHRQCAVCPKCNHTITGYRRYGINITLGTSISALLFLALSLPYQFLSFAANGQHREIDIPTGLLTMIELDYYSLAVITALATLVLPGMLLAGLTTLSAYRLFDRKPSWLTRVHRAVRQLLPWSMAEIFLVGTLVSLVKITDIASIDIGASFVAFCLFIVCITVSMFYYDDVEYANWLSLPPKYTDTVTPEQKTLSVQQTWALLFTACLLYIPANVYPIMHTELFGTTEPNTIISGVVSLWQGGSYPIAAIIFFASVVIPMAKLIVLAWLNWSVQTGASLHQQRRSLIYHVTEWIGRWSMIDVFVVAILVALIQLGNTISIYPGHAALAFCAVVFFTMLAAMTFDARLIWQEERST